MCLSRSWSATLDSARSIPYTLFIRTGHSPTGQIRMRKLFFLLVCIIVLSACNTPVQNIPSPTPSFTPVPTVEPTHHSTPAQPTVTPRNPEQEVLARAAEVILLLKNQDMAGLTDYTHQVRGIRFSPYSAIQPDDLVFFRDEIAGLSDDPTVYHWGIYDGSGMDMDLTFADYYAEFVYDVDFASAPQVAVNQRQGQGNTIDNSAEVYPGEMIVEYHFPGFDPQYDGMDWRSLRLVFRYCQGDYYLIGIIHDEWTP